MPIIIRCPLSKQAIKKPVIYEGSIYDELSLRALAALGKVPADLIKNLQKDFFTQTLLDHDQDTIPLDQLDEFYPEPITLGFPQEGILCVKDGRLYEKRIIEDLYKKSLNVTRGFSSPIDEKKRLSIDTDFFTHPLYQHLMTKIKEAEKARAASISLSTIFNNFKQPEPQRILFDSELKPEIDAEDSRRLAFAYVAVGLLAAMGIVLLATFPEIAIATQVIIGIFSGGLTLATIINITLAITRHLFALRQHPTTQLAKLKLEDSDREAFQREISKLNNPTLSPEATLSVTQGARPEIGNGNASSRMAAITGLFAKKPDGIAANEANEALLNGHEEQSPIRGYGTSS